MKRVLMLLVAVLAVSACENHRAAIEPSRRAPAVEVPRDPYDVWLDALEDAHLRADRLPPREARRVLEAARDLPSPQMDSSETVRVPLEDLQFRLAMLALDAGDPALARDEALRGLALEPRPPSLSARDRLSSLHNVTVPRSELEQRVYLPNLALVAAQAYVLLGETERAEAMHARARGALGVP